MRGAPLIVDAEALSCIEHMGSVWRALYLFNICQTLPSSWLWWMKTPLIMNPNTTFG